VWLILICTLVVNCYLDLTSASGRKQTVPASVGGVTVLLGHGRSESQLFVIPTGQLQLFGGNSALLAKSGARSPVTQYLSSHLFQKVTFTLSYIDWRIERKQMTLFQRAHSNWPPFTGSFS
jgi:hypothetical protein